jgi:hypothetical protein
MTPSRTYATLAIATLVSACGDVPDSLPSPTCNGIQQTAQSANADGRWLLGLASRYPADNTLSARADELHRSQRARRVAAWQAVARTLAPIALAHETGVARATVPRFQTWYDREDFARVFQQLYGSLSREQRAAQARFTPTALDEAFGFNAGFVTTLPEWPASRLAMRAASINTPASLAAVSGIMRVGLSPDTVRHLANSYPDVLRCINNGPPAFTDGPIASQQMLRDPITLPSCGVHVGGPFFVASGGQLTATVTNASDVELRVLDGVSPAAPTRCLATTATGCTVAGPGIFQVRLAARGRALQTMLNVQYSPPARSNVATCLESVFPTSAATVAIEWRRTDLGMPLPTYDTSATGLARRLAPQSDATWGAEGDGTAEPSAREAYTMRLPVGSSFRLAGMHIRTRELEHWLNITLWYSPRPNEDFGADRPAEIRALGAPWSSYKMCVAMDYDERDPDPSGGFSQDAPSLAAALRTVYEGVGGPSWCSNPYIDAGPGLVRSNCVGCHQHAMSGVRPAEIQNDLSQFPFNARSRVRNNVPSDGFWGLDGGDRIAAVFAETVDYWRSLP